MPLIEIVPSPSTSDFVISQTLEFWNNLGRTPIVLKKEVTGFVANRLAFALLREAIHLIKEGVVDVTELDRVVESSMGLRWAKAGPFKSYAAGGGEAGFEGLMQKIGATVQACWDDTGKINMGEGWEKEVFEQTEAAYGVKKGDSMGS
jgi:3-hydroxyacyl-CoA dehydrogenase